MSLHDYNVGDIVLVPEDAILGTEPFEAEVISLEIFGYRVKDYNNYTGPVGFDLEILQDNCWGERHG